MSKRKKIDESSQQEENLLPRQEEPAEESPDREIPDTPPEDFADNGFNPDLYDTGPEEPLEPAAPEPEKGEPLPDIPKIEPAREPVTEPIFDGPLPNDGTAKPKSDRGMIIFGGIVLLFAVFGLICTIVLTTKGVSKLLEKPSRDGEYEWLLTPLVLQDPPQFASPEKITDSTLITAGVWRLIMNEDVSKYPTDTMNFITVPASDIEVQIKALFGDVRYTHQSVGDTELLIIYDEANRTYEFPAVPHVLAYTPDVEKIAEEDEDTLLVTVGYIPPGPVWQKDTSGNSYQPAAEKQMTYTLKKAADGSWRVYAMGSVDGGEDDRYSGNFGPVYPESSAVPDIAPEGDFPETSGEAPSAPDASDEAGADASAEGAEDGGAGEGESSGDSEDNGEG